MFYGQDESYIVQDIIGTPPNRVFRRQIFHQSLLFIESASFITSLVGYLPVLVIKQIFLKSKPGLKHSIMDTLPTRKRKMEILMSGKVRDVENMRKKLMDRMYPLPSVCRVLGWIILLSVSLAACYAAVCCLWPVPLLGDSLTHF